MASSTVVGGASDEHLLEGGVSGAVEKVVRNEVVTFVEDGEVVERGLVGSPFHSYGVASADALENSVLGFLRRPVRMLSFSWADALVPSPTTGVLFTLGLPWDWINRSMIKEKLSGFRYLRTDFEVRVVVNAQPSQAGAMMVLWVPFGQSAEYRPANVYSWSGYPHALLDISSATAVTLRVPYAMLEAYFDLLDQGLRPPSIGQVVGVVISPLRGGNPNVDGTVFLRAIDPRVEIPTGIPIANFAPSGQVQCFGLNENRDHERNTVPDVKEVISTVPNASDTVFRRCASVRAPRSGEVQMDQEAKAGKKTGAISGALRSTAKVVGALGDIPSLSSLAKPAEWVLNVGAGVAGMFGFSKPQDPSVPASAVLNFGRNVANYDGDTKAKCLGFASDNAVYMPKELYGDDQDQMAISYVVQRPVLVESFVMTSVSAVDEVLFSAPVGIALTSTGMSVPTSVAYCDYLSQCFQYWRGELIWRFQVIKTPLHSARVEVIFIPGMLAPGDAYDQNRCYREIFDLRERSDFEFRVPFAYGKPWCRSDYVASSELAQNYTGFIEVRVLNQLRNPSICAPEIEFLVWKSAGKDFQFARPWFGPRDDIVIVQSHGTARVRVPIKRVWDGYVGAPGEGEVQMDSHGPELTDSKPSLMEVSKTGDFDMNQITFGEAVTSLRQLLKRNDYLSSWPIRGASADKFQWVPFDTAGWSAPSEYDVYGVFGYISQLYRFMSGSLVIGFQRMYASPAANSEEALTVALFSNYQGGVDEMPIPTPGTLIWDNDLPVVFGYTDLEKYTEVRVPHYYPRPARLTDSGRPSASRPGTFVMHGPGITVTGAKGHLMSRFAGEDFSMGLLLPTPSLVRRSA